MLVGILSDVLYPIEEQRFLAEHLPEVEYHEIESLYGHDGFLTEGEQISELMRNFLYRKNDKNKVKALSSSNL